MSWRNHETHREETKAVKKALLDADLPVLTVGHGTGTAWSWLEVELDISDLDHEKIAKDSIYSVKESELIDRDPNFYYQCVSNCSACETWRQRRDEALRIIWKVTGRHGDYNGNVSIN